SGFPVPQPDPKVLEWRQPEQSAPRPKQSMFSKPMSLFNTGAGKEKIVAARSGPPQLQPDTESTSLSEVLTGGGRTQLGAARGSVSGNTAVVEVATPGSGASGGSNVETPGADSQPTTPNSDPNDTGAPPTDANTTANPPAADTLNGNAVNSTGAPDGNQPATGATADNAKTTDDSKPAANNGKESTSKKKKGIKKIIPW